MRWRVMAHSGPMCTCCACRSGRPARSRCSVARCSWPLRPPTSQPAASWFRTGNFWRPPRARRKSQCGYGLMMPSTASPRSPPRSRSWVAMDARARPLPPPLARANSGLKMWRIQNKDSSLRLVPKGQYGQFQVEDCYLAVDVSCRRRLFAPATASLCHPIWRPLAEASTRASGKRTLRKWPRRSRFTRAAAHPSRSHIHTHTPPAAT